MADIDDNNVVVFGDVAEHAADQEGPVINGLVDTHVDVPQLGTRPEDVEVRSSSPELRPWIERSGWASKEPIQPFPWPRTPAGVNGVVGLGITVDAENS